MFQLLATFQILAVRMRVSFVDEKTEGPFTILTYLQTEFDMRAGISRLPEDKMGEFLGLIIKTRVPKKVTL